MAQIVPTLAAPFDLATWATRDLQDRYIKLWHAAVERDHHGPQIAVYRPCYEPVVPQSKELGVALPNVMGVQWTLLGFYDESARPLA